jgi:diguanylate cyclase (GGDEF)-like protein/PAS domain S-box-containing protein
LKSRTANLLVVDDQEMNRDMLKRRLERKGYRVKTAQSGLEALDRIQSELPDLLLLDVEMPGLTGLEVLSRVRENHSRLRLPVIMVTGRTESESIVQALTLGANDYITKPVDMPVAAARIETHLSLKWTEEALRESEERYALAADGANDGLWDWNLLTDEAYFSSRWQLMLGHEVDTIAPHIEEWFRRVHPDEIAPLRAKIQEHLEGRSPHFECEHRVRHRDGNYRWMVSRGMAVRTEQGNPTRMAGSQRDVTSERVTDPLTRLPNRLLFLDRLGCLMERARRQQDYSCAVLFLDLDHFNLINDSLGNAVGDALLVALSERLDTALRSVDTLSRFSGVHTVARMGGDQFCILLDDIKTAANATRVAERLLNQLALPFNLSGQEVFITASIGIALSQTGSDDPELLVGNAETAKSWARSTGKGTYELFDPLMRDRAVTRLQLEAELRRALERKELYNNYQMIVSTRDNRIVGFEALMRWHHPARGIVPPSDFIPVAEETGLILDFGQQCLDSACRQLRRWRDDFGTDLSLVVSVNLSARQLIRGQLVERIQHALRSAEIDPKMLKLEVTESSIMQDVDRSRSLLEELRAMGIKVAIDDFGTGYSSLSYLVQFPVDTLKMDRSFVSRMGAAGENSEIVASIIHLAHDLGLDVVAEGVESAETYRRLTELGCDCVQGYYLGEPMDASATEGLLRSVTRENDHWLIAPVLRGASGVRNSCIGNTQ